MLNHNHILVNIRVKSWFDTVVQLSVEEKGEDVGDS